MNPIDISPGISPLPLKQVAINPIEQTRTNFANIIKDTISKTAEAERVGEQAMTELASGQARNLHEVMISVEKADISLKMLVQFRNKALQAYEEVMRMQI
jgi:flagellar hook-basal body complex protein FliE